jgi:hypothetical protein
MSWFKRKPRTKEPVKHITPHRTSPIAEKMLKEAKIKVRSTKKPQIE